MPPKYCSKSSSKPKRKFQELLLIQESKWSQEVDFESFSNATSVIKRERKRRREKLELLRAKKCGWSQQVNPKYCSKAFLQQKKKFLGLLWIQKTRWSSELDLKNRYIKILSKLQENPFWNCFKYESWSKIRGQI